MEVFMSKTNLYTKRLLIAVVASALAGHPVLRGAEECKAIDWNQQLLDATSTNDQNEILQALKNGADINVSDQKGVTALIYAATEGHTNIVQLLLENGAKVNAANENGNTALMQAAHNGHTNIVQLLLEKGANVNAQENNGNTALMVTIASFLYGEQIRNAIVLALLNSPDIDLLIHNKSNETAYDIANRFKKKDVITLIEPSYLHALRKEKLAKVEAATSLPSALADIIGEYTDTHEEWLQREAQKLLAKKISHEKTELKQSKKTHLKNIASSSSLSSSSSSSSTSSRGTKRKAPDYERENAGKGKEKEKESEQAQDESEEEEEFNEDAMTQAIQASLAEPVPEASSSSSSSSSSGSGRGKMELEQELTSEVD